jgi:YbgC/YbaW family acyl-CoA thioester hydrolase
MSDEERQTSDRGVTLRFRVAMIDVDVVQIHFAAYFQWMDRGLQEILMQPGAISMGQMLAAGYGMPMVAIRCAYFKPARLGDVIEMKSHIIRCGSSSFDVEHIFFNEQGERIAEGVTTQVFIELASQRAVPLPEWLRALCSESSTPEHTGDKQEGAIADE